MTYALDLESFGAGEGRFEALAAAKLLIRMKISTEAVIREGIELHPQGTNFLKNFIKQ